MTRRHLMGAMAGTMAVSRRSAGKASQPSTKVNFEVPADACDSHTHIFGPPDRFPMFPGRTYTPEPAGPDEMASLHRALHLRRVVMVTSNVYGTDNSATLYGIKARGRDARGIALIDDKTPESALDSMGQAGIRGIRLNFTTSTGPDARKAFQAAVERIKRRGWHVQIYGVASIIPQLKDLVLASPVPVTFDHFGGAQASLGTSQPGFAELLELLRSGKAYVKISGAYRASTKGPSYEDTVPLAKALIGANPDRIVWGTDWPHPDTGPHPGRAATDLWPLLQIDDGALMNQLPVWAPDPAIRKKILVDNPARLYGF
jgi:predicted TIM-barrel fold metal-dependent hydrolase